MAFRRRAPQPTHGWLISNRILRWFAWAFLIWLALSAVTLWTLTYSIRRNCYQPYHRQIKVLGYWLYVDMGSAKGDCPQEPLR